MQKKIHAAVMVGPGKIQIQDFPWPKLEEGSMLVKMEMSGICGTDKHAYKGNTKNYAFPLIPGHENVGIVAEITKKASEEMEFSGKKLREGDRVVICPDIICGKCYFCKHSFGFAWCENIRSYGATFSTRDFPYITGGWAEYMYIFPGSFVYKVPEGVSLEMAVLAEPMANTYSLDKLKEFTSFPMEGLIPDFSIVIQGIGPIGLMHLIKARILGAGNIVVIGKHQFGINMAKEFGADYTLSIASTSQDERISFVKDLTKGRGVDIVINCTGRPDPVLEGLEMLRRGGIYLETSNTIDLGTIPFSPYKLCTRCYRIIGSFNVAYIGFIPSMNLMKKYSKWFPFEKIVTHKYPLEEVKKAIDKSMEPDRMKVVITP